MISLGFAEGVITGATLLAGAKFVFGLALKRNEEQVATRRKQLVSDLEALFKEVAPLSKDAFSYYSLPSSEGIKVAAQIKLNLKLFGIQWAAASQRLQDMGYRPLQGKLLVAYRQALTSELDVERSAALPIEHPTIKAIVDATAGIFEELSSKRSVPA